MPIPKFTTTRIYDGFKPQDKETKDLYGEVEAFAKQGQPIVIFGPTGAGKEFLARHYYKTLIDTEFYQQNKENWVSKFNEIRKQYEAYYEGKSLEIYLNSIKAGSFQAINSATIYPDLAESILFGNEAKAFTDAVTSPGLLESIKYGVLFLDEIGELTKDLQAKLLRAMDSEISEGRRLGGKMDYSLKDIIIISATNRSKEELRKDFFHKIGIEVEIKGIDERPNDVQMAIPYFICKAIGKRKDYAAVINMFGITADDIQKKIRKLIQEKIHKLSEKNEIKNFLTEEEMKYFFTEGGKIKNLFTEEKIKYFFTEEGKIKNLFTVEEIKYFFTFEGKIKNLFTGEEIKYFLPKMDKIKNFAAKHSNQIANKISARKWPGNFRALRIAIEASIFRIESTNHIDSFSEEFRKNLDIYIERYSENPLNTRVVGQTSVSDTIFPSSDASLDQRILDKFIDEQFFQNAEDIEQKILSVFLSSVSKSGFRRRDLEKFYKSHHAIRFTSEAHIRGRINKLLELNILKRTGEGKSTRYLLTKGFLDSLTDIESGIFALPKIKKNRVSRKTDIDMLDKVLQTSERIYIQSQPQQGKTTFVTLFCHSKDKLYNFYYYPLGETGIEKFFEDIRNFLQSENIPLKDTQLSENEVDSVHPYLKKLFKTKDGNKPVLILDNAQYISDPEETKTILDLSGKWQEVILILIGGDKMDNAFYDDFHEFQLEPWNRHS